MTFEIWLKRMEPSLPCKVLGISFIKFKNSIAWLLICLWNSYPRPYVVRNWKPSTYATCYLIELCQIIVTLCEIHFILPWSRSRTLHIYSANFYTRSCARTFHPSIHIIPQIKLHVIHDYSLQVIISRKRIWAMQK